MYYDDNTVIYHRGQWQLAKDTTTGLYQQSFHYGNGVFEGIRSYATANGAQILRGKAHYERLLYSAETMHMEVDYTVDDLLALTQQLLHENQLQDAYIRPLLYTDEKLGLQAESRSHLFLCAWDWSQYFAADALAMKVSPYCRPDPRSCHVDAKVSGHYVNSILAMKDAHQSGFDDALLLDQEGHVAEASGANFFYQKNGCLFTPPTGHILPGITRQIVMELAAANGIPVHQEHFKPEAAMAADGAFLTGTAVEIQAIGSINGQAYEMPWNRTFGALLQAQFHRFVRDEKVKFKKIKAA